MRVYLEQSQRVPFKGSYRNYRGKAYYNVSEELGKRWIAEELACPATKDNTHKPRPPKPDPAIEARRKRLAAISKAQADAEKPTGRNASRRKASS